MADNITLDAGTGGAVLAADDIASVWYQIAKLAHGALDSATIVSTASGLPVQQQGTWTLGANSGVDIGDVTINNGAGASAVNIQDGGNALTVDWAGTAPPIGAGTEAAALRVTVATDSTGVLSVDDNGGALTVDNAGTFVTQVDGAALTALQLIDNLVLAEDAAHVSGDPGVLALGVRDDDPAAVSGTDGDNEPLHISATGRAWVSGETLRRASLITLEAAYTTAQTDAAIITAGAGDILHVTQIQATTDEATTVGVGLRVGFAAVTTPTTTGVVLTHPGMVPGSGISRGDGSADIGVGADGEDLRITSEVPTTGSLRILVSYWVE